MKRLGAVNGAIVEPGDEDTRVPAAPSPDGILVLKAGGDSGIYSELLMNYHGLPAITIPIRDSWEEFRPKAGIGRRRSLPSPRTRGLTLPKRREDASDYRNAA